MGTQFALASDAAAEIQAPATAATPAFLAAAGLLCLRAGGNSEAREHFYALLRLRPADPDAHAYLACLLAATIDTIARLKQAGIARMLLQVHDPRQSMVSAIHHYTKLLGRESADAILLRARLPRSYESWDTERRIDHYIETELQAQIHWVEFWLEVARANDPGLRVLTSRFQDFAADSTRLFHDPVEFFAIPPASIDRPLLSKPPVAGELHFRTGKSGEWRQILNPAQYRRAGALMPAALERYFEAETVSLA